MQIFNVTNSYYGKIVDIDVHYIIKIDTPNNYLKSFCIIYCDSNIFNNLEILNRNILNHTTHSIKLGVNSVNQPVYIEYNSIIDECYVISSYDNISIPKNAISNMILNYEIKNKIIDVFVVLIISFILFLLFN